MIGEAITGERNVTLYEVKYILAERKKVSELKYEQEQSSKYANNFCKVKKPELQKLTTELEKIPGINTDLRVKIIDVLPRHIEVMKALMEKGMEATDAELEQAQSAVNEIIHKK